ncbi:oncoprotein-induced transcript 3 protein-like [Watersipora subatra]|uniref:oncoprotein-induced transcript 3 protein-like n=1 Tax=Watersipora subatra TaxID=2589382 RepID=UPI00355B3A23
MKGCILFLAALVASTTLEARRHAETSTTTTTQEVSRIMRAVEDHCSARRKRQVGPSSEDKVRRLILNVVKDCLEDDDDDDDDTPEPTTPPSVGGPCTSPTTVNLTEDWRLDNKGSDIQPINGSYNCDAPLFDNIQWFRITGAAGNRIRNSCSPPYSCGSHGGIWSNATHPTTVGEIRQGAIYGSWAGNCDWYTWPVEAPLTIQKCGPGNDFVYRIDGTSGCYHSVCGMRA